MTTCRSVCFFFQSLKNRASSWCLTLFQGCCCLVEICWHSHLSSYCPHKLSFTGWQLDLKIHASWHLFILQALIWPSFSAVRGNPETLLDGRLRYPRWSPAACFVSASFGVALVGSREYHASGVQTLATVTLLHHPHRSRPSRESSWSPFITPSVTAKN